MKDKIKNLLKKIKLNFKYGSRLQQIGFVLMFILLIDMTISTGLNIRNTIDYNNQLKKFNSHPDIVKLQKEVENSSILNAIKKIKNIKEVIFQSGHGNINTFILTEDNALLKLKEQFPFSIATVVEPELKNLGINYYWTKKSPYSEKYIYKPEKKYSKGPITSFFFAHLYQILILSFFAYMISANGMMKTKNTFDILLPGESNVTFDSLVGMDKNIKREILQLSDIIKNRTKYHSFGIESTFNILFQGPAGTGKTKTAEALSNELKLPMVVGTGNVETGYVGGGARALSDMFKTAERLAFRSKRKAAIVFIDEGQVLIAKRGKSREKWADDSTNELLELLDGLRTDKHVNIIVIIASNFDSSNFDIDEAVERRFKKKLYFRLPDKEERKEIISFYLNKIQKDKVNVQNIERLAEITSGLSPAKIETIINEASLIAISKDEIITDNLLYSSFEKIMVGYTFRDLSKEEERYRIAVHEIGHFIAEYSQKIKDINGKDIELIKKIIKDMNIIKISSERIAQHNALGYVLNGSNDNLKTIEDYWVEIIALYGGYVSEKEILGSVSLGATNDFEKISKLIQNIVGNIGYGTNVKLNMKNIQGKYSTEEIEAMKSISKKLYKETENEIIKNKKLILYLADRLMDKWVLYKSDIEFEIEEFLSKKDVITS